MCSKLARPLGNRSRAFTFIEFLFTLAMFGIAGAALCTVYGYSTRTFIVLANYAKLDAMNRQVMDTMTREIRQARLVSGVTSNSVSIVSGDNLSVTYTFDPSSQTLTRFASDGSSDVLLPDCTLLNFEVFQRNNISNTFDQYPIASQDWSEYVKVVRLTWKASLPVPGGPGVSENIQTARIIIRKQH